MICAFCAASCRRSSSTSLVCGGPLLQSPPGARCCAVLGAGAVAALCAARAARMTLELASLWHVLHWILHAQLRSSQQLLQIQYGCLGPRRTLPSREWPPPCPLCFALSAIVLDGPPPPWCRSKTLRARAKAMRPRADCRGRRARRCHEDSPRVIGVLAFAAAGAPLHPPHTGSRVAEQPEKSWRAPRTRCSSR